MRNERNLNKNNITVILATYNGEKYIKKQLLSVFNQSIQPNEVIITDDNSKDGTLVEVQNFIEEYKLVNWRIIRNQKNKGFGKNFLDAVRQSNGDVIFLCDQDDIWHFNKIEVLSNYLIQHKNAFSVSCCFNVIDSNDKNINVKMRSIGFKRYKHGKANKVEFQNLLGGFSILGCCMCFRSSIIKCLVDNYVINKYGSHDTYINILSSVYGDVFILNDVLMSYRIHGNNTSLKSNSKHDINNRIKKLENQTSLLNNYKKIVEQQNIVTNKFKVIERIIHFNLERINALKNRNILSWIRLLRKIYLYKVNERYLHVGLRIYFADLYYILKINKYLNE